jgi:hypothetical protein
VEGKTLLYNGVDRVDVCLLPKFDMLRGRWRVFIFIGTKKLKSFTTPLVPTAS